MVTTARTSVAFTVVYQRDVTGQQDNVRADVKWAGKEKIVIQVHVSPITRKVK